MKKKKKAAKRVKILKVEQVEPDKHVLELEIEGAELPAEAILPSEPLELEAPEAKDSYWVKWLKSLF
jgi:hypothetical protein